ncbi:hypothetical protein N7475_000369 [Penicillium sp. IBT 31633x]|nr:hypothetical protein N7475_000369 [Penicillium sp. IBT 31633x]
MRVVSWRQQAGSNAESHSGTSSAAPSSVPSSSENPMAEIRPPDYKSLFNEADSKHEWVEASRERAEARQERAAASQERTEASQKQADEERHDWEHARLTNFGEFLRHCHTYPPDR